MPQKRKRSTTRTASVYYIDQLNSLDLLCEQLDCSRSDLLRKIVDDHIALPENQAVLLKDVRYKPWTPEN